uniref:SRS domain-containing protein n=1 Tax=Sarcocystis aucheniae TaxID=65407 RepID=A0A5P9S439_9APIC|nr:hypothetical protein [Sarcocystis aucheniae]
MKLFGLALLATLAVLVAVAPPLLAESDGEATKIEVTCDTPGNVKPTKVSKPNTTVQLQCQPNYTLDPAAPSNSTPPNVYTQSDCTQPQAINAVCANATGTKYEERGLTLNFPDLPPAQVDFYLKCTQSNSRTNQDCVLKVTVEKAPTAGNSGSQGDSHQESPPEGTVQQCPEAGQYITLKIQKAGATAQFACGGSLSLIPTDPTKVFAENCTKQEDLQDLERSDTKNVFTLTATKKPPKKKLCYLCGKPGAADAQKKLRTAEFCAVYVETGAGTKLLSRFTFSLMLSCVATALQFS